MNENIFGGSSYRFNNFFFHKFIKFVIWQKSWIILKDAFPRLIYECCLHRLSFNTLKPILRYQFFIRNLCWNHYEGQYGVSRSTSLICMLDVEDVTESNVNIDPKKSKYSYFSRYDIFSYKLELYIYIYFRWIYRRRNLEIRS